jgi:hypothetical protein
VAGVTDPGAVDGGGALRDVAAPEPGASVAVRPATAPGPPGPVVSPLHAGRLRPTAAASSTATVAVAARRGALTRSS